MAITIGPSARTARAYRGSLRHPVFFDLALVVFSFFALCFGIATATISSVDYSNGYMDYQMNNGAATAVYVSLNLAVSIVALLTSLLNIYFYANICLHPAYIVAWSFIMGTGWIISLMHWVSFNTLQDFYYDYSSVYSNGNVTWGIMGPQMAFGILACAATILYFVMAWFTLLFRKHVKDQSAARLSTPPQYEDVEPVMVHAQPTYEPEPKMSTVTHTCVCNCGAAPSEPSSLMAKK